jgi:hypothetical protein
MSNDQDIKLRDFVSWVRRRRIIRLDAPINDETIEYVAQGIERFLDGKNPWPQPRGNKTNPSLTWEPYWMVNFDPVYAHLHKKRHTESGGLYAVVGEALRKDAKTVETQVRNALNKLETEEGRTEFCEWVGKMMKTNIVKYTPKK